MTKGLYGEPCADAVRASIRAGERLSFGELHKRTKRRETWSDSTLYQHLMAPVANLPPARRHWPSINRFLLLNQDGTYELYDSRTHPPNEDVRIRGRRPYPMGTQTQTGGNPAETRPER